MQIFSVEGWGGPFFRNTGTNYERYLEAPGIVFTIAAAAAHV
jgi:hypothetical protein